MTGLRRVGIAVERRAADASGTSLVELVFAVTLLGVGLTAVASLTALAARELTTASALDEAHGYLQAFVDSAWAASAPGIEAGSRAHEVGVLSWHLPQAPGAPAWARFEHHGLAEPVRLDFFAPSSFGSR
ncbi:MAG: hypothetical protein OXG58_02120 [Gemmatimonadetes bacterium]|nr:hypothetical protein [Gemmatimonadota bacterium]MCY3943043.1 hypothetical protein [Gemmatimonadota bacterium]